MFFARIFRRKKMKAPVRTLRIDGTKTTLTPKPDDAELAAQALLETLASEKGIVRSTSGRLLPSGRKNSEKFATAKKSKDAPPSGGRGADYYQNLSSRIKLAHEQERRAAMRYVSYVEEQLSTPLSTQGGAGGGSLERGLYQHQDAIEREGGELKKRWQKCLALVIMKQYKTKTNTDLTDDADEHQPSCVPLVASEQSSSADI